MTSATILLPRHLNLATLTGIINAWPRDASSIVVDFRGQVFVYPAGTVGLSCLASQAIGRGQELSFQFDGCENVTYWERMGFFSNFNIQGIPSAGVRRDSGNRFSEVRVVNNIDDVDRLTAELVDVAAPSREAGLVFSHIVSEALNNVCQHSGARGFCASQYYELRDRVHFCIADHGMGLLQSLADYGMASDSAAVMKALEVGVSGRSRAAQMAEPEHMRNRGVGLSAIHRLVIGNRGVLDLWSGDARYSAGPLGGSLRTVTYWPGTLISATMPRGTITAGFHDIMRKLAAELREVERERADHRPLTRMP